MFRYFAAPEKCNVGEPPYCLVKVPQACSDVHFSLCRQTVAYCTGAQLRVFTASAGGQLTRGGEGGGAGCWVGLYKMKIAHLRVDAHNGAVENKVPPSKVELCCRSTQHGVPVIVTTVVVLAAWDPNRVVGKHAVNEYVVHR